MASGIPALLGRSVDGLSEVVVGIGLGIPCCAGLFEGYMDGASACFEPSEPSNFLEERGGQVAGAVVPVAAVVGSAKRRN